MIQLDKIYPGDNLATMRTWPDAFVQTVVTSPPYFGLRDYGHEGQIGNEDTPDAFIARLVGVFREVKRVLRDDGTLWLNLGDSYAGSWGAQGRADSTTNASTISRNQISNHPKRASRTGTIRAAGVKAKDLYGIPWMAAFALRADGWYLRQEIIWNKPNPMPSSVTDRCTRSHEHIFMLSKSPRYYYDHLAIRTPLKTASVARLAQNVGAQNVGAQKGSDRVPGKTNGPMKAVCFGGSKGAGAGDESYTGRTKTGREWDPGDVPGANKKSVWTVTTKPFKGNHFATFPMDLIEPCILAGAGRGGVVLDPFMGAGTTGLVAARHGRRYVGCELNPEYVKMAEDRINKSIRSYVDEVFK